jgi:predicted amidophosphoribosyltransferase
VARACPVCTTDHPDTAQRCSHCGSPLAPAAGAGSPAAEAGDDAEAFLKERSGLVQALAGLDGLANAWAAYLADQQAPPERHRGVPRPAVPLADVQRQIEDAQAVLRRFDHQHGTAPQR